MLQVLADATRYAPGAVLPPHLSPFVATDAADEEEHVPDYALELRRLQVRWAAHHIVGVPCCALLPCLCPSVPWA